MGGGGPRRQFCVLCKIVLLFLHDCPSISPWATQESISASTRGGVVTEEPLDRFLARLDLQSPPEILTGQRVLLGTDYDRLLRELAESRAKHARQAELNCALVSQNCKLIERNRDLGDVAPPWNPPEP